MKRTLLSKVGSWDHLQLLNQTSANLHVQYGQTVVQNCTLTYLFFHPP